jgi:hypothetical protein
MEDEVDQLTTAIVAIAKEFGSTKGDQAMRGEKPEKLNRI